MLFLRADQPSLAHIGYDLVSISELFGIPVAMTIAILGTGCSTLTPIISRAVAYGLLSAVFTGVYVAIVVGLGAVAGRRGGPLLTIAAAICIAVLFQPLRLPPVRQSPCLRRARHAVPGAVPTSPKTWLASLTTPRRSGDGWWRSWPAQRGRTGPRRGSGSATCSARSRSGRRGSVPPPPVALGPDGGLPAFEQASRAVAGPVRR